MIAPARPRGLRGDRISLKHFTHKSGTTFDETTLTRYIAVMAASVTTAPVLKTLNPGAFQKRLTCDRTLLPADGIDVPIVLDLAGCHAKPRVLASCTSGQELMFSEPTVEMVHRLADDGHFKELRVRFSDREVATLPGPPGGKLSLQAVADELVGALVRQLGKQTVAAALARSRP